LDKVELQFVIERNTFVRIAFDGMEVEVNTNFSQMWSRRNGSPPVVQSPTAIKESPEKLIVEKEPSTVVTETIAVNNTPFEEGINQQIKFSSQKKSKKII
jgi:hypothetical protein